MRASLLVNRTPAPIWRPIRATRRPGEGGGYAPGRCSGQPAECLDKLGTSSRAERRAGQGRGCLPGGRRLRRPFPEHVLQNCWQIDGSRTRPRMCTDRALLPATLDVSQDLQLFLSSKVMRRPNACGGSASTWTDHLRCHGEQIEKALQSRCWRDSRLSVLAPLDGLTPELQRSLGLDPGQLVCSLSEQISQPWICPRATPGRILTGRRASGF